MGDTKLNVLNGRSFLVTQGEFKKERPMKSCGVSLDILAVFYLNK